nr:sugar ABC transporter substrate-binding protein [Rhizobium sp. Q54]
MKRTVFITSLAAVLLATPTFAVGAERPLIAVFTKNLTNPAYAAARRGADLIAEEMGAETRHFVPEKPDDVEQQKALVDEALAAKPDLVLFVPVDDKAMVEDMKKITDAGIPVVSFINRMEGEFVSHVGSDDVAVGYNGAKALIESLGGKGRILAIEGNPAAPTSRDRVAGMRQAIVESNVELLDVVTDMYQEKDAHDVTAAALEKYQRIDGIWAANDVMVYGALAALSEANRAATLVGANGLDKAIQLIEDGTMLATVEFSAFKIACTATRAGMRKLAGQEVSDDITIPSVLIDKTNFFEWKVPLEKRDRPGWEDVTR